MRERLQQQRQQHNNNNNNNQIAPTNSSQAPTSRLAQLLLLLPLMHVQKTSSLTAATALTLQLLTQQLTLRHQQRVGPAQHNTAQLVSTPVPGHC